MATYCIYNRETGNTLSTNNKRTVSEFSGIGYEKLVYHFTRRKRDFYKDDKCIIIKSNKLVRGKNRGRNFKD